jgi:hypothetical protein
VVCPVGDWSRRDVSWRGLPVVKVEAGYCAGGALYWCGGGFDGVPPAEVPAEAAPPFPAVNTISGNGRVGIRGRSSASGAVAGICGTDSGKGGGACGLL